MSFLAFPAMTVIVAVVVLIAAVVYRRQSHQRKSATGIEASSHHLPRERYERENEEERGAPLEFDTFFYFYFTYISLRIKKTFKF